MLKGGKLRISAIYARETEPKERVRLIKEEYGISGHSYHFLDGTKGFVDANGKGILVRNYEYDSERLFRWTEIEQRIGRMIRGDRYLTAEERESLQPVSGTEPAQMSWGLPEEPLEGGAVPPASENVIPPAPAAEIPAQNYRITDEHLGEGGPKAKYERNVAAIRTLFTLEQENRNVTPEEQSVLAQYVGWGGLPDAFDPEKQAGRGNIRN